MVKTEELAGEHSLSKSNISYKRGIIALQRCGQTGIVAHNLHALVLRQQQITNIKYHHQQRLFSSCKSTFAFHIVTDPYPRGADYPVIG
jgi:hypothetical protein